MSAGWTVLSLCVCVCVCVPMGSHGALVISRDSELLEVSDDGGSKHLTKRSATKSEVEVLSIKVDCKVASRFAHTVMTTTALNKANSSKEAFFDVELPKTAFITNFSMEIEGQVYVGEVKEKEKAKKQYEKAVSSGQTAGLVKASGRKMEKFSVSVNIAANSNVIFVLTYEELLQRHLGKYEMMIRVKPKQLVQNFQIVADIYEPQGIAFLDAYGTFMSNDLLPLVEKTVTDKKAHVSFSPTLEQQRACEECTNTLIDGDFFIKYDVNRAEVIGDIQVVNGYFVHFFAPADLPTIPKNVVFVIDRSGSMSGIKMLQTREALVTILNDLHEEDYFGLIKFDDQIEAWSPSLKKASPENVKEAVAYAKNIVSRGGTNINDAVISALNMIVNDTNNNLLPTKSASMIILLTDGDPTSGETYYPKTQENVRNAIGVNITLFCLGFGYDLNYGFLDVMAKQNNGLARRIYEASDAVLQLQGFYDEVASPLLLEVDLHYPETMVNSLTTSHFKQLFNGSEIVVAGRLNELEMNNFLIEVSAQGLDQEFAVQGQASAQEWDVIFPEEEYIFGDFTERLWAYLTIQQLLDEKDRHQGSPEEKANATAKALDLSLQYSFVTPLTSMVVTKPQTDDKEATLIADKLTEEQRPVGWGDYSSVVTSYRYSSPTYLVDGDPHFIIELPDKNDSLCFNIDDTPGTIFSLVKDTESGIFVNGQTIGDKKVDPGSKVNTYFGSFGIVHEKLDIRLLVTTHDITVSEKGKQMLLLWSDSASIKGINMELKVKKGRSLTVTLRDSVKFVILLHKVWEKHPYHQDYLGFYTLDTHLLPHSVHGLLGQFYHGVRFEVSEMYPGQDAGKPDADMLVKGHVLVVTRGWQRDFRHDIRNGEKVPCWFIHNNGTGLIDGTHEDYKVSGLFKTF